MVQSVNKGRLQREQSPEQRSSEATPGRLPGQEGRSIQPGEAGKGTGRRVSRTGSGCPTPYSLPTPHCSLPPSLSVAGHSDPALPTLPATCQQHAQGSNGLTPVGPPWALPDYPLSRPSAPTAAEPSCPCSASPAALSLTQGDSGLEEPEAPSSPHGLI